MLVAISATRWNASRNDEAAVTVDLQDIKNTALYIICQTTINTGYRCMRRFHLPFCGFSQEFSAITPRRSSDPYYKRLPHQSLYRQDDPTEIRREIAIQKSAKIEQNEKTVKSSKTLINSSMTASTQTWSKKTTLSQRPSLPTYSNNPIPILINFWDHSWIVCDKHVFEIKLVQDFRYLSKPTQHCATFNLSVLLSKNHVQSN